MPGEDIFEALAARRALASTPTPWLDAARGAIPLEEAALRVQDQEDPALLARSMQLFAPGEPAVDEQRLEWLLAQGVASSPRGWAWRGVFAVAMALTTALVLVLVLPRSGEPLSRTLSTPYALELEQGVRLDRAATPTSPSEVTRYYAHRDLRATLRPGTAVLGGVEASVHVCEAGIPRRLPVMPRVGPRGVIMVESRVAALGLGEGEWELLFVVGTEPLPPLRTCEANELTDGDDVQVLRTRIEIIPPPR